MGRPLNYSRYTAMYAFARDVPSMRSIAPPQEASIGKSGRVGRRSRLRQAMHVGKGTYRSLAEAEAAAEETQAEIDYRRLERSAERLYGYPCLFGNHYHYGHSRDRDAIRIQEERNDRTGNGDNEPRWGGGRAGRTSRRDRYAPG